MSVSDNQVRYCFAAMRPHQWTKNAIVFAPALFGKTLFVAPAFASASVTFAAFCLLSGCIYLVNDLIDLDEDRAHPVKRERPLPSGKLRAGVARSAAVVTGLTGVGMLFGLVSPVAGAIGLAYLGQAVLYSLALKHLVILDVMFIAVGFILRILAGAVAVGVPPSHWLLLCTLNLSLFLGFVKRRAELAELGDAAGQHRRVLDQYSPSFLDQMVAIVTSATVICYALYTVDERTVNIFGTRMLVATVPFVLYGMFRYLYLTYHQHLGGNPARVLLADVPLLLDVLGWGAVCAAVIYGHETIRSWLPL